MKPAKQILVLIFTVFFLFPISIHCSFWPFKKAKTLPQPKKEERAVQLSNFAKS
jgi:hypothetical protein